MSTEHLHSEIPTPQDKEWEATMLSFVEQSESGTPKTESNKKPALRRRTMTVILSSVGTVLLAVILLVVTLFVQPSQQTDSDTDSGTSNVTNVTKPTISLLNNAGDADQNIIAKPLQSVDIQNSSENYSIVYDDTAKNYVIKGYEDLALDDSLVTTLRTHTETIQAVEEVADSSNLAAFGLDKPQATASITYSDGSTARLRIGNATPSETGFYGQFGDSDKVYIFASDNVALFRFRASAFVNTLLVATPTVKSTDSNGVALLRSATFSGAAHSAPLTLRRSNDKDTEEHSYFTYLITSPYFRAVRDTKANELGQFKSLTATQALVLHPTEEQKKKLGFDNPLMQLTLSMAVETEEETEEDSDEAAPIVYYNSTDYQITVGSLNDDGNYIVMLEDVNAIFLVSKADYGYLFDTNYTNAVNEFLFVKAIESISRVAFRTNGNTYEFTLTHYPDEEEQNDRLVVKSGDKVYPTEDFRELYGLTMDLERFGSTDTKPTGDVPLEVFLYDEKGDLYLSAKYYDATGSVCAVETNEGELFTTRWSYVSFFIQQVENYINGRDVLVNT